jgi:hypothetical protein
LQDNERNKTTNNRAETNTDFIKTPNYKNYNASLIKDLLKNNPSLSPLSKRGELKLPPFAKGRDGEGSLFATL